MARIYKVGVYLKPCTKPLGSFIRQWRLQKGLSLEKVTRHVGWKSSMTLSQLERGVSSKQYLSHNQQAKMCEILGCPPELLEKLATRPFPKAWRVTRLSRALRWLCRIRKLEISQIVHQSKISSETIHGWLSGRNASIQLAKHRRVLEVIFGLRPDSLERYKTVKSIGRQLKSSTSQLGNLVRTKRLAEKMSQKDLAVRCNTTPQAISLIELGRTGGRSTGLIDEIAQLLGLSQSEVATLRSKRAIHRVRRRSTAFCQQVTDKRVACQLTQAALAKELGLRSSHVSEAERGQFTRHAKEKLEEFLADPNWQKNSPP